MGAQRLLVAASFTFMLGVGAAVSTLPIVLRQISSNELEVSLAVTVWGLAYLVSNIPAGVLADRLGAGRVAPLAFLSNVAVGLALFTSTSVAGFAVARAAEGVLEAIVWTSVLGLAAKSEGRLLGISDVFAAIALGFSLGPIAASQLALISARSPFLAYSLCALISFFLTLPLRSERQARVEKPAIRAPASLQILPPLIVSLTVGLTESLIIVYSPVIAEIAGLGDSRLIVSGYYLLGLLGQVAIRLNPRAVTREYYVPASFLLAALALAFTPLKFAALGVLLLGFVNAQAASRSQAKVAELMQGVESTGAGLANLAWALGYFTGSPLYSSALAASLDPLEGTALFLAASLALQVTLGFTARSRASRARTSLG